MSDELAATIELITIMKIEPNDLTSLGYKPDKEPDHSQIVPFGKANLRKTKPFSIFFGQSLPV